MRKIGLKITDDKTAINGFMITEKNSNRAFELRYFSSMGKWFAVNFFVDDMEGTIQNLMDGKSEGHIIEGFKF